MLKNGSSPARPLRTSRLAKLEKLPSSRVGPVDAALRQLIRSDGDRSHHVLRWTGAGQYHATHHRRAVSEFAHTLRPTIEKRFYSTVPEYGESPYVPDEWIDQLAAMSLESSDTQWNSRPPRNRASLPSLVHEVPMLEDRFDSILKPNHPETNTISPFDWRNRAPSRQNFRRNAKNQSVIGSSILKPRLQRQQPQAPSITKDMPLFETITNYRNHFLPLLEAEKAEERALIRLRLQTWPIERLESEGFCIRDVHAYWLDSTNLGRPVASFSRGVGLELPRHLFRVGDDVYVSRNGPLEQTSEAYRGQVSMISSTSVAVTFDTDEGLKGKWRLDLGSSDIALRRMKEAMNSFFFDPKAQQQAGGSDTTILRGTHLRDVLLSHSSMLLASDAQGSSDSTPVKSMEKIPNPNPSMSSTFMNDMRLRSWCARYSRLNPIEMDGDPPLFHINNVQRRAIAMMLGERMSLVQGPPGTGKTRTIIEAIRLLKAHFEVPHPILVCTYTNAAVDNLVEGLATPLDLPSSFHKRSTQLKPLRVGAGSDPKGRLLKHNFLTKIGQHALKPELDTIQHRIDKLQDMLVAVRGKRDRVQEQLIQAQSLDEVLVKKRDKLQIDINKFTNEKRVKQSIYFALYRQMTYDVCHDADVICTTNIASACFALTVLDFPVVFIDEASMSTEPATLIPIMKGCQHLSLIGDHKQLPPVIVSRKAKEGGLGVSLFERLIDEGRVPSIMLDVQYRMHPGISRFPSAEFYDYNLLDGTVDSFGNVAPMLMPPNSSHLKVDPATGNRPSVIFLNHDMPECSRNRSRANDGEAMLVVGIIEDLLRNNPFMNGSDIGVISPYVAQTVTLRSLLTTDAYIREHLKLSLGRERASEALDIEVKTVDGFEGREKEVIVFSTVRNNDRGDIGFLADRRRLNVGLTRAKRALFLLGNSRTLSAAKIPPEWTNGMLDDGTWRKYIQWLTGEQLVVLLQGADLRKAMVIRSI